MLRIMLTATVGFILGVTMGCSMNEQQVDRLTREWILVWNDGNASTLPLADDFEHTSPYGVLKGRDHYLEVVVPMAKKNAARLTIDDVMVSGNQSAVRYKVASPSGETMRACDWLLFQNGKLAKVWSYYERPAGVRDHAY